MQKKLKILSLGDWPREPKNRKNVQISPITKRILSQVHIHFQQILPITYQRYVYLCQENNQAIPNQVQYRDQLERRKKQVQILVAIRNSYILRKDYGLIQEKNPFQKSKEVKKSRASSKYLNMQSRMTNLNSSPSQISKLSRNDSIKSPKQKQVGIFTSLKSNQKRKRKVETQRQQSEYYLNFSKGYKQSQKSLKKNEQSTKIRHLQSSKDKANRTSKVEYGYEVMNNINLKQRKKSLTIKPPEIRLTRVKSSQVLYQQLLSTLKQWENLDQKHLQQVQRINDLSTKERDRLLKMQMIEKQKMRSDMKKIKKRLNSESKFIKSRNMDYCLE